jgi:hypothetical protein
MYKTQTGIHKNAFLSRIKISVLQNCPSHVSLQVWFKNNTFNNCITISNGTSHIMMAQPSRSIETPLSTWEAQNQNP